MRKALVLAAAAIVAAPPAWAEWMKINESAEGHSFYADPDTFRWIENTRRVWILTDYPKRSSETSTHSTKTYEEFDCQEGRFRYLQSMYYTGPMGSGQLQNTDSESRQWTYPAPESVSLTMLKFFCGIPKK